MSEWISVKDRLPRQNQNVLVYITCTKAHQKQYKRPKK
jgi:hypothetical protein